MGQSLKVIHIPCCEQIHVGNFFFLPNYTLLQRTCTPAGWSINAVLLGWALTLFSSVVLWKPAPFIYTVRQLQFEIMKVIFYVKLLKIRSLDYIIQFFIRWRWIKCGFVSDSLCLASSAAGCSSDVGHKVKPSVIGDISQCCTHTHTHTHTHTVVAMGAVVQCNKWAAEHSVWAPAVFNRSFWADKWLTSV